jgi:uncharacterized protein YaiI (UPF0178 family)
MQRHMAKKARRSKKKIHLKGPAKRTEEDDDKFAAGLIRLIELVKSSDESRKSKLLGMEL